MRLHMVDTQCRNAQGPSEAFGKRSANEERAHQPGPCGVGDTVDVIQSCPRLAARGVSMCDLAHMIARC